MQTELDCHSIYAGWPKRKSENKLYNQIFIRAVCEEIIMDPQIVKSQLQRVQLCAKVWRPCNRSISNEFSKTLYISVLINFPWTACNYFFAPYDMISDYAFLPLYKLLTPTFILSQHGSNWDLSLLCDKLLYNLLDSRHKIRKWVSIHNPYVSNLGIEVFLNQNHSPWIIFIY